MIEHHQPQHQCANHDQDAENPTNQLSYFRIGGGIHRSFPRYRKKTSHSANVNSAVRLG